MNVEQKAVIARATREGLAPSELAAELLTHDLLNSAIGVIRGHAVAFKNMSQQQQDEAISTMQDEFKKAVDNAVRIIAGAGSKVVRMKLKKVAIGTSYQIQGVADRAEENLHALCDKAQDQSDVLIVLYEGDYHQGLDAIQGEKDQKPLPLEGETKAEKKPRGKAQKAGEVAAKLIELPPALVDQAREFVITQQNGSIAGLQNQLKCNHDKAKALHDVLVAEGLLSEEANDRGDRELVRKTVEQVFSPDSEALPTSEENAPVDESDVVDAAWPDVDDALYVKAKMAVIADQRVSVSFIKGELGIDDDLAAAVMDRLQEDGVVSEENEMGGRAILIKG
jgi:DNA segregation ATPase FtsK/SpoIIIE-like protein/uncharacterized protein YbjQ (UPF0145 family)